MPCMGNSTALTPPPPCTHMQMLLGDSLSPPGVPCGRPVLATCPERQMLAYTHYGAEAAVHLLAAPEMMPVATIKARKSRGRVEEGK